MAPSLDKTPSEFSFRSRQRDWNFLKQNPQRVHNVIIIGGGIVGAGILRELSLQNLPDVYLFEKNDFASGTSGKSSKLIHAGIRYLEQVWTRIKKGQLAQAWENFVFVLEASRERKILGELAPHLVKPKPIYLVLGEGDNRSTFSVMAGVWLYYLIQIFQGQFFSPPQAFFRKDALKWGTPELDSSSIKAIFSFWDSETDDARLVIQTLQSANEFGGHALNYVELLSYEQKSDCVFLQLKNNETNEVIDIQTKVFFNTTGPWVDEVRANERTTSAKGKTLDRVAGAHIDIYPALTEKSYYITAADGRLVFILKRDEDGLVYTRIGTTERPMAESESSDSIQPSEKEVEYLKRFAESYLSAVKINDEQIIRLDEGIRPLRTQEEGESFEKSREHAILQDQRVIHVIGVKLTDFRRVAEELITVIPWKKWGITVSAPTHSEFQSLETNSSDKAYAEKNIQEVVKQTMVLHWSDYVYRRRGLRPLLNKKNEPETFEREFIELAEQLNWDTSKRESEFKNK